MHAELVLDIFLDGGRQVVTPGLGQLHPQVEEQKEVGVGECQEVIPALSEKGHFLHRRAPLRVKYAAVGPSAPSSRSRRGTPPARLSPASSRFMIHNPEARSATLTFPSM